MVAQQSLVCGSQVLLQPQTNALGVDNLPLLQQHTFQSRSGQQSCTTCNAGEETFDTGNTACSKCAKGYFNPTGGTCPCCCSQCCFGTRPCCGLPCLPLTLADPEGFAVCALQGRHAVRHLLAVL